jgi:hypothetical protein
LLARELPVRIVSAATVRRCCSNRERSCNGFLSRHALSRDARVDVVERAALHCDSDREKKFQKFCGKLVENMLH